MARSGSLPGSIQCKDLGLVKSTPPSGVLETHSRKWPSIRRDLSVRIFPARRLHRKPRISQSPSYRPVLRSFWISSRSFRGTGSHRSKRLLFTGPFALCRRILTTRILEKQNLLQMSQVLFRCPRINHQVVLLFKDSKRGSRAQPLPHRAHSSYLIHLVGLRRGLAGMIPNIFLNQAESQSIISLYRSALFAGFFVALDDNKSSEPSGFSRKVRKSAKGGSLCVNGGRKTVLTEWINLAA